MESFILAVTGVPACGKTTLCARLGPALKAEVIDLNRLIEGEKLYEGFDKARDTKIVDIERLANHLAKTIRGDVILDGLLSHRLGATHSLVLRCDPRILGQRMRMRGYSTEKVMENVEAEYLGVLLDESLRLCPNVLEADNTNGIDVEEVVRWLSTGGKTTRGTDWSCEFLSFLESMGRSPT